MKFKNKYINKIISSGLVGGLLLSGAQFNSFANINKMNNSISVANTENEDIKEISPQMLAVLSSLAVASGITITTDNDLYDLCHIFYDYIDRHNDLTWATVQSVFSSSVFLQGNQLVSVKSDFLDIVKDFFDDTFSTDSDVIRGIPKTIRLPITDKFDYTFVSGGSTVRLYSRSNLDYFGLYVSDCTGKVIFDGSYMISSYRKFIGFTVYSDYMEFSICEFDNHNDLCKSWKKAYGDFSSVSSLTFPYNGGYTWDNVDNKKENDSIALPIPGDLGTLVGQGSTDFWDNTDNLINPCTQEISLPEVDSPSISVGESVKLQTDTNCSIYNAEELVTKAEESKDVADIENARNEVNKLPESQDKEELQNRLDAIVPNIASNATSGTANLDIYIKSENMLSLSLDTNSVTFEGYSGAEPMEKLGAVNITIDSSLPYDLNAYMPTEIANSDKSETLPIDILNIRESGENTYQQFENNTEKIVLKQGCISGNDINHSIDLKLDSSDAYVADVYKTVIKFEAEQK